MTEDKEVEAFRANLEKGGEPYLIWIRQVCSLAGWDAMYDYKVAATDKCFNAWKEGVKPEMMVSPMFRDSVKIEKYYQRIHNES